jgi:hypothetical protein
VKRHRRPINAPRGTFVVGRTFWALSCEYLSTMRGIGARQEPDLALIAVHVHRNEWDPVFRDGHHNLVMDFAAGCEEA